VLQREPDNAEAKEYLARAYRRMKPLTDDDNQEIRRLHIEAMQYSMQKEYQKAIDTWRKIFEIDPENESAAKNIEEAQQKLRKIESQEGR